MDIDHCGARPRLVLSRDELAEQFGDIDIYLFDQILRGRILPRMRIFDAGCGGGRNLVYFLRQHFDVSAADSDPEAIACVLRMAAQLHPDLPGNNFRAENLEQLSFPEGFADVVISNAVLHFASDQVHFRRMLAGSWRVLAPGGLFFCRLASSIGMPRGLIDLGGGRYLLPDGSERFLASEPMLMQLTGELGAELADPLKTTVVQGQRCMTTWVLRKFTKN